MQQIEFNTNSYVYIQLTDVGRAQLKAFHDELFATIPGLAEKYPYEPPVEDGHGWSKFQLWEVMKQLGPKCGNGFPVPFYTTIRFDARDAKTVTDHPRA